MNGRKQMMNVVQALCFCSAATLAAQTAPTVPVAKAQPRVVALASDACPSVSVGEKISLEWNPGFEHTGMVSGMNAFSLSLARLRDDGSEGKFKTTIIGGGKGNPSVSSFSQNGFFHIELTVPAELREGVYHVVDAEAFPSVYPEFENQPRPQMTVSPARERFCITVVRSAAGR